MRNSKRKQEQTFLLSENSGFLMKEDYRALRTNIEFSFPAVEKIGRVIAVASSEQRAGKSTTSLNIAICFAELGKKVLLVECDLRIPVLGIRLRDSIKSTGLGLTDLLVGEAKVGEVIRQVGKTTLDVVLAGTIPPDPTRLLQSNTMENYINDQKKKYDYIILDCPPINSVIDAITLAPLVDGYLVVVRHKNSDLRGVEDVIDQLKRVDANILGFVYTDAASHTGKYYKKSYYYYKK